MLRYLGLGERPLGNCPMPPHPRLNWEFLAVVSGELAPFGHDGEEQTLQSDTIWLFPPGYVHGWRGRPGKVCEIVVIHFSGVPEPIERLVGAQGFLSVKLNARDKRLVLRLGRELKPHYWQPVLVSEIYSERALLDLCLILFRGRREVKTPNLGGVGWTKAADAEAWLRRHIHEAPSINDAARAVGISASQLRRVFSRVKKKSPKQVLDKIRFDKAMHLMAQSDAKLERIAEESGFSSATNFCRAFKAFVGRSPTAWRNEIYIQYKKPREFEKDLHDHHGRRYREL